MLLVTVHLMPGQTDRDLQRDLLALDPAARVRLVTGRNGRTGALVDGELALRYLARVYGLGFDPAPATGTTHAADVEVTVVGVEPSATTESGLSQPAPVADQPPAKSRPPAKKAAKKTAPAVASEEEV